MALTGYKIFRYRKRLILDPNGTIFYNGLTWSDGFMTEVNTSGTPGSGQGSPVFGPVGPYFPPIWDPFGLTAIYGPTGVIATFSCIPGVVPTTTTTTTSTSTTTTTAAPTTTSTTTTTTTAAPTTTSTTTTTTTDAPTTTSTTTTTTTSGLFYAASRFSFNNTGANAICVVATSPAYYIPDPLNLFGPPLFIYQDAAGTIPFSNSHVNDNLFGLPSNVYSYNSSTGEVGSQTGTCL
jgi:hypothetical protein